MYAVLKSTLESERLKLLSELKLVHSAGRLLQHGKQKLFSNIYTVMVYI